MDILAGLEDLSVYDCEVLGRIFYTLKHGQGRISVRNNDVVMSLHIVNGGLYGFICNIHYIVVIFPMDGCISSIIYKHRRFGHYDDHTIKNYCYENLERYVGGLTVQQLMNPGPVSVLDLLMENRDLDICCPEFTNIVLHFMKFYRKKTYLLTGSVYIRFTYFKDRTYGAENTRYEGFISNERYIILMMFKTSYYISLTYVQNYDEQTYLELCKYLDNSGDGRITKFCADQTIHDMKFGQFMQSKVKSARK